MTIELTFEKSYQRQPCVRSTQRAGVVAAIAAENTYKSATQLNTNNLHCKSRHRKETYICVHIYIYIYIYPPSPLKILTSQQRNSTQTTYIMKLDIEKRPQKTYLWKSSHIKETYICIHIYVYKYIYPTNNLHCKSRHRKETTKDLLVQK